LIPKADPFIRSGSSATGVQVGVDVGASLAKIAIRSRDGTCEWRSISHTEAVRIPQEILSLAPDRVGITGGGASALRDLLSPDAHVANEFAAWGAGARSMLRGGDRVPDRFLLVSVGTGTAAILVTPDAAHHVGGTGLGGGTIAGLGSALVGTSDAVELARLAASGDRARVDLQVADIYPSGNAPLPGEINASSFAKLALRPGERPSRSDLARSIVGMVGENIALICGGLAAAAGVDRIVYGGTTVVNDPVIAAILRAIAPVHGCTATILPNGAFTGALGALELAAAN
jgi:type II pantothenate kinase